MLALVAPKPDSDQPRQAGLPDRLQSLVCRAASLSTGLNKKSAPSSGMVGVPDVSPQGRGADRTPEVRLQSWYDAGSCQLPANLNTAIACLQPGDARVWDHASHRRCCWWLVEFPNTPVRSLDRQKDRICEAPSCFSLSQSFLALWEEGHCTVVRAG